MSHGGYRENAGRKTTWVSGCKFEDTKLIRVPIVVADELLNIAHKLDSKKSINSTEELIKKAKLITNDPSIVRVKDRAAVRRAFIRLLDVTEKDFRG